MDRLKLIDAKSDLCEDFESQMVDGMLRYTTEIKDRWAKYCRDRHRLIVLQQENLASVLNKTPRPKPITSEENDKCHCFPKCSYPSSPCNSKSQQASQSS